MHDARVLCKATDPHKKMLARLDYEGRERTRLAAELDKLKAKKEVLAKANEEKTSKLNMVGPLLTDLLTEAKPLEDLLGGAEVDLVPEGSPATNLPTPLYNLFINLGAISENIGPGSGSAGAGGAAAAAAGSAAGPASIKVSVDGDVDAAKEVNEKLDDGSAWTPPTEEDADADAEAEAADEENGTGGGGSSRRGDGDADGQHAKLMDVFPLRLSLRLSVNLGSDAGDADEEEAVTFQFCYLHNLKVITVMNVGEADNHELLSSLYPADDGLDLPNARALYAMDASNLKMFSEYLPTVGRPYRWAQTVAGLPADGDVDEKDGESKRKAKRQSLVRVLGDIRSKVKAVRALGEQLKALEKLAIELPAAATKAYFPLEAKSVLHVWKKCAEVPTAQLPAFLTSPGNTYYTAEFKRGKLKLAAVVVIPKLYPLEPPYFKLSFAGPGGTPEVDANINVIESEVNIHFTELVSPQTESLLLLLQLRRVQMCFDVFCETQTDATGKEGSVGKVFVRGVRGKDRIRPYVFDHQQGLFVHRTTSD